MGINLCLSVMPWKATRMKILENIGYCLTLLLCMAIAMYIVGAFLIAIFYTNMTPKIIGLAAPRVWVNRPTQNQSKEQSFYPSPLP